MVGTTASFIADPPERRSDTTAPFYQERIGAGAPDRSERAPRRLCSPRTRVVVALVVAAVLSFVSVFSYSLRDTGYFQHDPALLVAASLVLTAACAAALILLDRALAALARAHGGAARLAERLAPATSAGSLAAHTAVMCAVWAVMFVALFPGSMNWDTYSQIVQVPASIVGWGTEGSLVEGAFSDHHPVFDSILFSAFARASNALFGTWNYGVFAFVAVQGVGTALAFVYALGYLRRIGAPATLCLVAYAFVTLFPFFPASAATMVKDSLFSWLYLPYFVCLVEIVRTRGESLKRPRLVVALIVLALLLALTRKPGMYVVIPTALVLAVAFRAYWKPLVGQVLAVTVVMLVVLPRLVFPAWGVEPGESKEMLTSLYQSTARFAAEYPDEVTDDERAAIDAVLGYDTLVERYNPRYADPVKDASNVDATAEESAAYLRAWLSQTLRHPSVYAEATLATAARFYSPGALLWLHEDTGDESIGGSDRVWQPAALDGLREAVLGAYHASESIPVVGPVLFSAALYVWWIPLFALFVFATRDRRWLLLLVPWAVGMLVVTVGPVYHPRYVLQLVYVAPLIVCIAGMVAAGADAGAGTQPRPHMRPRPRTRRRGAAPTRR